MTAHHRRPALRGTEERNRLVTRWLELVPWALYERKPCLRSLIRRTLGHQDAKQIGRLALLRAAELWDSEQAAFSTYATWSIRSGVTTAALRYRRLQTNCGRIDVEESRDSIEEISPVLASTIAGTLKLLSGRDQMILRLYYGLVGNRSFTLDEIAAILTISKERVRQLRNHAIDELRCSRYAAGQLEDAYDLAIDNLMRRP